MLEKGVLDVLLIDRAKDMLVVGAVGRLSVELPSGVDENVEVLRIKLAEGVELEEVISMLNVLEYSSILNY